VAYKTASLAIQSSVVSYHVNFQTVTPTPPPQISVSPKNRRSPRINTDTITKRSEI